MLARVRKFYKEVNFFHFCFFIEISGYGFKKNQFFCKREKALHTNANESRRWKTLSGNSEELFPRKPGENRYIIKSPKSDAKQKYFESA